MDPSMVQLVITRKYDLVVNAETGLLELALVSQDVVLVPKEPAVASASRRRAAAGT
jgi:hypothetical protein